MLSKRAIKKLNDAGFVLYPKSAHDMMIAQIEALRKMNGELHDRLMARNLDEYKKFEIIHPTVDPQAPGEPIEDNYVGEVI